MNCVTKRTATDDHTEASCRQGTTTNSYHSQGLCRQTATLQCQKLTPNGRNWIRGDKTHETL